MKNIFITGTDTGVGKTALTAILLKIMHEQGMDAIPMKPVQTGCEVRDGELIAPDLEYALSLAGLNPSIKERKQMCPYRFEPACSPHLAGQESGQRMDIDKIKEYYAQLKANHELVIVEGAGGVLVPLNESRTMLDLMKALGLPVILAARPGLGTLNHTLLSLQALRNAGLSIIAVVLIDTEQRNWGLIEQDNMKVIREMGQTAVVTHLPYLADITTQWNRATEALTRIIQIISRENA